MDYIRTSSGCIDGSAMIAAGRGDELSETQPMLRFRIVTSKEDAATVLASYSTAEEAVGNCPPGRAVRDAETGKHVDSGALMVEKKIRWF